MKNIRFLFLIVFVLIFSVAILASCKPKECEHSYGEWTVVKEATCTEQGEKVAECSKCKKKNVEKINALGHNFLDGTCSRCGEYEVPIEMIYELKGDNTYKFIGVSNSDITSLVIPTNYNGKEVSEIADGALQNCNKIKKLTVPFVGNGVDKNYLGVIFGLDNVYKIGGDVDTYKEKLSMIEELTILSGTTLDQYSLAGLTKLFGVFLPEGLETIGDFAFYDSKRLHYLTPIKFQLPSTLKVIGNSAFENARGFEAKLPQTLERIGDRAYYNTNVVDAEIPYSVTYLGKEAYAESNIGSIKLGRGIKTIEYRTFYNCKYLYDIVVPDSITHIGNNAFESCGITSINIGKGVESIGEMAFYLSSLQSLKLPDNVKVLGDRALLGSRVTRLETGNGLTDIGDHLFGYNNQYIKEIVLGKNIKNIGKNLDILKVRVDYLGTIESWCQINLKEKILFGDNMFFINGEAIPERIVIPDTI